MALPDPTFPPLLNGIAVTGAPAPFALARSKAAAGVAQAGDFFWNTDEAGLDCAVVLAPEVATPQALHMMLAAMVAAGDSLGAIGPPELGVFYRWPGGLIINGASIGDVRVALPDDASGDDVPKWLVIAIKVRLLSETGRESGYDTENTTLVDEGCVDLTRTDLVESFARHFLVWIHTWSEDGIRPVHEAWMQRALNVGEDISLDLAGDTLEGKFIGLDNDGNMLLKSGEETKMLALGDCVERGVGA